MRYLENKIQKLEKVRIFAIFITFQTNFFNFFQLVELSYMIKKIPSKTHPNRKSMIETKHRFDPECPKFGNILHFIFKITYLDSLGGCSKHPLLFHNYEDTSFTSAQRFYLQNKLLFSRF